MRSAQNWIQGEVDIAAVPANLASVLYNKTNGGVQVLAVNTLGVLYIVEDGDTVHSIADLKGRTIYAGGKGATPEYALNYILEKNGLVPGEDVTIEWKSEHAECVAALAERCRWNRHAAAAVCNDGTDEKKKTLRTALDLTEEWNKIQESEGTVSTLVTGVTVVRTAFAKEHPEAVADFMEAYQASVSYVTENTDEAAKLIGDYDIVPGGSRKALPACNIVCITGDEMKEKLSGYLGVLKDQNPEAVGGELPGDDFYYSE